MSKIYEALLRAELERMQVSNSLGEQEALADPASSTAQPKQPSTAPPVSDPLVRPLESVRVEAAPPTPQREAFSLANLQGIREVTWSPSRQHLQALDERGSVLEQFRTLRSRIQEFRGLNKLKTILVSSGKPQEGKSFVSMNLALSLARFKSSRVLLIDGDMRRSSLQTLLGTVSEPGLTEYLAGNATIEQVLQRGKVNPGDPPLPKGLSTLIFLPAGGDAKNAADLSGNYRFAELIEAVSPHVDWIIIDSSPVNLVSDAANLARSADAVLLVAHGGVTTFQSARRAMSELKSSKILGLILNAMHDAPKTEGYYGHDEPDSAEPN